MSQSAPVWRSPEPDWYAAMCRPLHFLYDLCKKHSCPLVVAGDVFDKWNPPPELINFALKNFRAFGKFGGVYAVPGQHDLPNHRYEDIKKSGYWTLVEAGVIENLPAGETRALSRNFSVTGFPWKAILGLPSVKDDRVVNLAVVHDYCWKDGHSFPGCPQEKHVEEHRRRLKGYTAAVFGDNHNGFLHSRKDMDILNCGSLMRRNADQFGYETGCGLLKSDGRISYISVPHGEDKNLESADSYKLVQGSGSLEAFAEVLQGLGELTADFQESCKRYMTKNRIPDDVQREVMKFVGGK